MESWERLVFESNICPCCSTNGNHVKLEPDGKNCLRYPIRDIYQVCETGQSFQ